MRSSPSTAAKSCRNRMCRQGGKYAAWVDLFHGDRKIGASRKLWGKEEEFKLGSRKQLFPARNFCGGGSPEGAEVQTCTLFSPLWAFFGYFLARQKVTTSPPQRRLEQQEKTACISQQYRLSSDKSPFHDSCEARKNPRNLSGKVAQNQKVCYNQIDIPFT